MKPHLPRLATLASLALAGVALALAGCGTGDEPYSRLHDAALAPDGRSIVLLVESGETRVRGSVFSGQRSYTATRLSLWRLARANGTVSEWRELAIPAGFEPFHSRARLADLPGAAGTAGESLPNCEAVLTECAIARTPEPYLAQDLADGTLRGLQLVDPSSGRAVRAEARGLVARDWNARTPASARAAKDAAMRGFVQAVFDSARARLDTYATLPDRGASERGATLVDSRVTTPNEGLYAEYRIDERDTITARLRYGSDAPFDVRWTPATASGGARSFACEGNVAAIANWSPGCRLMAAPESVNPEIVYLRSAIPQLKESALQDTAFQKARRGATFGVRFARESDDVSWVACLGVPGTRVGDCDVARGDTPCSVSLPLLCVKPDPAAAEGIVGAPPERWFAARVAASARVRGDALASSEAASAACASEFGKGWRIASLRDRGDGFVARGYVRAESRLWIDVPGQPGATCWDR